MAKDEMLKQNIMQQIDEYQIKGYAHLVSEDEKSDVDPRRTWFLP